MTHFLIESWGEDLPVTVKANEICSTKSSSEERPKVGSWLGGTYCAGAGTCVHVYIQMVVQYGTRYLVWWLSFSELAARSVQAEAPCTVCSLLKTSSEVQVII